MSTILLLFITPILLGKVGTLLLKTPSSFGGGRDNSVKTGCCLVREMETQIITTSINTFYEKICNGNIWKNTPEKEKKNKDFVKLIFG